MPKSAGARAPATISWRQLLLRTRAQNKLSVPAATRNTKKPQLGNEGLQDVGQPSLQPTISCEEYELANTRSHKSLLCRHMCPAHTQAGSSDRKSKATSVETGKSLQHVRGSGDRLPLTDSACDRKQMLFLSEPRCLCPCCQRRRHANRADRERGRGLLRTTSVVLEKGCSCSAAQ